MGMRCFSRRHLVAARSISRQIAHNGPATQCQLYADRWSRRISSSAAAPSTAAEEATETSQDVSLDEGLGVHIPSRERIGFFTSQWRANWRPSHAQALTSGSSDDAKVARRSIYRISPHPHALVKDLLHELDVFKRQRTNKDAIWRTYNLILAERSRIGSPHAGMSTSALQQSLFLPPGVHRDVLRSQRPFAELRSDNPTLHRSVTVRFITRASRICGQMHQIDPPSLPTRDDYECILEQLSESGDVDALLSVWTTITNDSSLLSALPHDNERAGSMARRGHGEERASIAPLSDAPSSALYFQMLRGISKLLRRKVEFQHPGFAKTGRAFGYRQVKEERRRVVEDGSLIVDTNQPNRIEERKRQWLDSASLLSSLLLQDMLKRGVPLRINVCNQALDIMGQTGALEGMKRLTKLAFAIDLDHPDALPSEGQGSDLAVAQSVGTPDVRTLNILIRALGEHSTVSKMIAAYETISAPLPKKGDASPSKHSESLFKTDFRGLFRLDDAHDKDAGEEAQSSGERGVGMSSSISPDNATLEALIRYACFDPRPSQLMMNIHISSPQSVQLAKEHAARREGAYINVALYFLKEALARQADYLERQARTIGTLGWQEVDTAEKVLRELDNVDRDESSYAALPKALEDTFRFEYLDRVLFMAGELTHETLLAKMESPTRPDQDLMSKLSVKERRDIRVKYNKDVEAARLSRKRLRGFFDESKMGGIGFNPIAMRKSFTPSFIVPDVHVSRWMVSPFLTFARQTRDLDLTRRVGKLIHRAMALCIVEMRMLKVAKAHWTASAEDAKKRIPNATNKKKAYERQKAHAFVVSQIDRQHKFLRDRLESLVTVYVGDVLQRPLVYRRAEKQQYRLKLEAREQHRNEAQRAIEQDRRRVAQRKAEESAAASATAAAKRLWRQDAGQDVSPRVENTHAAA